MDVETRVRSLPLFPLANVVLFPGVRVPLHLFEPRYRALAKDVLAGDSHLGMAVVRPEHMSEMEGDPPLYEIGCEGVVEQSQLLPDGRYNVVLRGTSRFRICEEFPRTPERLYRVASVERLPEEPSAAEIEHVARHRDEVLDALIELLRRIAPDRADALSSQSFDGVEHALFVNALAQAVEFQAPEKQALLEAESVALRCDQLLGLLQFRLAEHEAGSGAGDPRLH